MGDGLRDGETESGTAAVAAGAVIGLGRCAVYEALKKTVSQPGRYAGPLIVDIDLHELIGGVNAHVHRTTRRRVPERVVEQIDHQAVQQHAIAVHAQFVSAHQFDDLQRYAA